MKGSLKLPARRRLNRSEAWACLTANLALPGSGSLAAGRAIGYFQMGAAFAGMMISVVTAVPMFQWAASGAATKPAPVEEPLEGLLELWPHIRWPLAGLGLFAAAFLWALTTSLILLAETPKQAVPPRIQ